MGEEQKKVLIVDDEPDVLMMLKVRIASEGFDVVMATSGQAVLDLALKENFDVIVTDVLMPNMDGFTFYKKLKKDVRTHDTPVLILTARGQMEDSFRVVGADEFLAKPYDDAELMKKIRMLANREAVLAPTSMKPRVLIIGDNEQAVEIMALQLKKAEHLVDFVLSGAQAISKAVMHLPSIIIETDIYGMDSHEIIHVFRQMKQFSNVPILVYSFYNLSELGNEDVRQRALSVDTSQKLCMEAGATVYIGRFSEQNFLKTVRKYIK